MNENEIVAKLRRHFPRIGDDAAIVDGQVITTDMLIEDVDFTRAIPLQYIARKSLAVNISDLAAMGAEPLHAVVGLGLPAWALEGIDAFFVALRDASRDWRIEIVGGDLSRADKLIIAITAIGHIVERPLLRSGAKPGDRLYLSRPIGGSMTGLQLLQNGWSVGGPPPQPAGFSEREFAQSAILRHVSPEPELDLGMALARVPQVTSCIDISDGLSTEVHHLCAASGCGAEIDRERIPIFPDLLGAGSKLGIRVQEAVLHGGEEYALLFTSSLRESELSAKVGRPVYMIGRMTSDRSVVLREDGAVRPLEAKGWDHFA